MITERDIKKYLFLKKYRRGMSYGGSFGAIAFFIGHLVIYVTASDPAHHSFWAAAMFALIFPCLVVAVIPLGMMASKNYSALRQWETATDRPAIEFPTSRALRTGIAEAMEMKLEMRAKIMIQEFGMQKAAYRAYENFKNRRYYPIEVPARRDEENELLAGMAAADYRVQQHQNRYYSLFHYLTEKEPEGIAILSGQRFRDSDEFWKEVEKKMGPQAGTAPTA
jgi:hypothetical protein